MRNPDEVKPDQKGLKPASPTRLKVEVKVDEFGRIQLPADLLSYLGGEAGASLRLVQENGQVLIEPNLHALRRLYIEPTSGCNLKCQTCIRLTWNEPFGAMRWELFEKLCAELKFFPHLQSIMLAGFGEPLFHPDIVRMVEKLKNATSASVEITTNGTLLDEFMAKGLLEAGLDRLWVSFDGTSETSFNDIRQGANFRLVLENVQGMRDLATALDKPLAIGISFVVMRDNINDLKNIEELIQAVGADRVLISNVLPYTEEMERQMLCLLALTCETMAGLPGKPRISLPRLDINYLTKEPIYHLLKGYENLFLVNNAISAPTRSCRFIKDGTTFVRWDGKVAPCMALLHDHITYLYGLERKIKAYFLGDLNQQSLNEIWTSQEYHDFREKVYQFDYSPCHICGGCSYLEKNEEDCFGNTFPVCGGCLWAQSVIQCP
ncbi:MAG: SPASM domain-containing protein [Candidatus Aminicenantes bacterium]|nr:SPASM domain-containing protein [Candidatus Aminicenantes bacterium]